MISNREYRRRINNACEIIGRYGMIDGSHHKQWVLDQVLRVLQDENYEDWIKKYNMDGLDDGYSEWDEGIIP